MRTKLAILFAAIAILFCGCTKESDRSAYPRKEFVMIYYGAGFNNLSSDISANIKTMLKGNIPFTNPKHILLTFTHLSNIDIYTNTPSDNIVPKELHLIRHSRDLDIVRSDTLMTLDASRSACDPDVLHEVMSKVAELYPDSHYGLVLSSHGTGWLPAGKYSNDNVIQYSGKKRTTGMPLYRYNENPDEPRVKSFGPEVELIDGQKVSREMTIQSMAAAIPIHLDYLIFDACLMGGIEVAYEFKDIADKIAFSPTEVLSEGFDYSDISSLLSDAPDIDVFCKKYYNHYINSSASISVVKTSGLDGLATVCKALFNTYRSQIASLSTFSGIQKYYREGHHWFFDLRDILAKAGASETELGELDAAIDGCISYKAATPSFLGVPITDYSGLSMYLPSLGDAQLNNFYKTLAWNKATNLVE